MALLTIAQVNAARHVGLDLDAAGGADFRRLLLRLHLGSVHRFGGYGLGALQRAEALSFGVSPQRAFGTVPLSSRQGCETSGPRH